MRIRAACPTGYAFRELLDVEAAVIHNPTLEGRDFELPESDSATTPVADSGLQPAWPPTRAAQLAALTLVALYLIPIWQNRYIPTQDGPAHLFNAMVLRDYSLQTSRYCEFFELNIRQLPNWTSHAFLYMAMHFTDPLTCEKLLVSGYLVMMVLALNYLATWFGADVVITTAIALLFTYGVPFFMGFYNFCLSVTMALVTLGYVVRQPEKYSLRTGTITGVLFLACYFSHLMGFLFAVVGTCGIAAAGPQRRRNVGTILLASVPAGLAMLEYFLQTGFFGQGGANVSFLTWWQGFTPLTVWYQTLHIPASLLPSFVRSELPLTNLMFLLAASLTAARLTFVQFEDHAIRQRTARQRSVLLLLSLLLIVTYYGVPDFMKEHGGFLKMRVILLAVLLYLVALSGPLPAPIRRALGCGAVIAAGLNLAAVMDHFETGNRDIEEFTAGIPYMGQDKCFIVVGDFGIDTQHRYEATPLIHAYGYYGVQGGNIPLNNYEATRSHFPVQFRDGVSGPKSGLDEYENWAIVDMVIGWDCPPDKMSWLLQRCRIVFKSNRLVVLDPTTAHEADRPDDADTLGRAATDMAHPLVAE